MEIFGAILWEFRVNLGVTMEIVRKFLENLWEFLGSSVGNFVGILWKLYGNSEGTLGQFLWEFWGILWGS